MVESTTGVNLTEVFLELLRSSLKIIPGAGENPLKLVDKGISSVDKDTRKFTNLLELSLRANAVDTVKHLPQSLKILNLYGNRYYYNISCIAVVLLTSCNFISQMVYL